MYFVTAGTSVPEKDAVGVRSITYPPRTLVLLPAAKEKELVITNDVVEGTDAICTLDKLYPIGSNPEILT